MNARELIETYRREIRDKDLPPTRAAELLAKLTALLGNVLEEIRDAEMAFNVVLLQHLDAEKKANRATIRAKTTPEYTRAKEAKDTSVVLLQMVQSLKVLLKAQVEEMKLAR